MANAPKRIAVTGAAGQIGYSLLFRIASGSMLGPDTPVILQLLEITPALQALGGVCMELEDCAFPTLQGIVPTDKPEVAFRDCDYALLVGAKPRELADKIVAKFSGDGDVIKAEVAGNVGEYSLRANIFALREIGAEQRLHHIGLLAACL